MSVHIGKTPEPVQRRPVFLRRRDWQIWRETYLEDTPADCRVAWVHRASQATDKRRLVLISDLALGGIKFRTPRRFESGDLLHLEIWHPQTEQYRAFAARVLRVTISPSAEFQCSCAFLSRATEFEESLTARTA